MARGKRPLSVHIRGLRALDRFVRDCFQACVLGRDHDDIVMSALGLFEAHAIVDHPVDGHRTAKRLGFLGRLARRQSLAPV